MKRFIVLISLIACMLLTACGKDIGNSAIASQKSKPGVSEVVLYEGHDLKLTMKAIYSIQGHRKSIVLNLDNDHTQPINVKCDQWIFNGTYVLSESALMYLDPLEDGKKVMEEMSELVELPETMFNAAGGKFLKVSIGKGNMTEDELVAMITRYTKYFNN